MKASIEFNYYTGPSHGWVKVPKAYLQSKFNWTPSAFSFEDKTHFFLEEDCDASKFINMMKAIGDDVVLNEVELKSEATIRRKARCAGGF